MAWTALTFAFGSILTSTKMTQLFDNFEAMANGDSGAPDIDKEALNTATHDISGTVSSNSFVDLGGMNPYAFFPNIYADDSSGQVIQLHANDANGSADSPTFRLKDTAGVADAAYEVSYRYVTT